MLAELRRKVPLEMGKGAGQCVALPRTTCVRLRVGEIRVFYDVSGSAVEVLAIIPKSQAEGWLKEAGEQA